jgi:hypothetical protein
MKISILILALALAGCATPPGHPFGIWEGGMRGPTDQACSLRANADGTTTLLACGGKL